MDLAHRADCSRPTIIALERSLAGTVATLARVLNILGLRPLLRPAPAPKRGGLVPATNAPVQDLVMTLPALAAAIIAHFQDRMSGSVLDPAKGRGAFYDQFPEHLERHWCELAEGRDFFDWHEPVDWVMTNPPWSKLRAFTRHASDDPHAGPCHHARGGVDPALSGARIFPAAEAKENLHGSGAILCRWKSLSNFRG